MSLGRIDAAQAPRQRSGSGWPSTGCRFASFDGGIVAHGTLQRPDRYRFFSPGDAGVGVIARGAGLSYAAASFREGGTSIEHRNFDRILDFDSAGDVVEVEAGADLATLHDFVSNRGRYLAIQPGHGRITIGGCIAVDAHGKNPSKDGTFIDQVLGLTLFHPEHGLIELGPDSEPALFRLTCGGYGLTGHILRARLKLRRIPSEVVSLQSIAAANAWTGLAQLARDTKSADFAYSWHDFTLRGTHFGRGYVFLARFAPAAATADASLPGSVGYLPALCAASRGNWRVPLLNRWTTPLLNLAYRGRQASRPGSQSIDLRTALFPVHRAQSYFKLFGSRGFHEYQAIVPHSTVRDYLDAIRARLDGSAVAVTLASAKVFCGRPELLRFNGDGISLALNLPRSRHSAQFLSFLDGLVIALGGRPNIIKDSRLARAVADACYPGADAFRKQLRAFDPKRRFRSELSERLGL